MSKLTKAQKQFLERHLKREGGFRPKFVVGEGSPNYDFVGRVRDLGYVEIVSTGAIRWPYSWDGTRITDAGRAALATPTK